MLTESLYRKMPLILQPTMVLNYTISTEIQFFKRVGMILLSVLTTMESTSVMVHVLLLRMLMESPGLPKSF